MTATLRFPYCPVDVSHRHGGTITQVDGIGHAVGTPRDGRSTDTWFFVGNVQWDDGGTSTGTEIAPFLLTCGAAGKPAVDALLEAMNAYLLANGTWCGRDTRHEGWYATNRNPHGAKRRR